MASAATVQLHLAAELEVAVTASAVRRSELLRGFGIRSDGNRTNLQAVWSQLARVSNLSLADIVRISRGELGIDPRPNKALNPATYNRLLVGYPHRELMMRTAMEGFRVRWLQRHPDQATRPQNHRSATACMGQVASKIADGEAAGTYLVVDAALFDQWHVHVSPFGAIPKGDAGSDAIRLIHDLSHPSNDCPNDFTDKESLPPICYDNVVAIARRIEDVKRRYPLARIQMLKGDVNGAFRHLRQQADSVQWMCGLLTTERVGVVDLRSGGPVRQRFTASSVVQSHFWWGGRAQLA